MKAKSIILLALSVLALAALAGCAQDSTDTTDDNPRMQEEVAKEKAGGSGSESTNPTRDGNSGTTSSKGTTLNLQADPSGALKYDPTSLTANAGKITINFKNESAVPHDVEVEGLGKSEEITKGSTKLVIKDAKAGTYKFFCTVPGHEQAGMTGELKVN